MIKDFINAATTGGGGATVYGAASGQLIVGIIGLVFMIGFGAFGAWLRWRDSKALHDALAENDFTTALKIRSKP